MTFATIRPASKVVGLPDTCLRRMQKENALPGFQSGNRFYVNLDLLIAKLDEESRANDTGKTTAN